MRGSRCARFEVRTVVGREDINNLLLLVCCKGGALWDIKSQYTSILLHIGSIIIEIVLLFNNQPGLQ